MNTNQNIISINEHNVSINSLKDECTNELNRVNHYYWPIIAKVAKRKKNIIWYFTLACCLIVSIILWILLAEITNPYWIGLSLGAAGLVLIFSLFFMVRTLRKYNTINEEWKKALKKPEELKNQILEECKITAELMLNSFGDEKEKIIAEIGTSYEDVLDYYNHWVDNN